MKSSDSAIVFVFTRLFHDEGWNECSIHSHRDCCCSKYGNLSQQKDRCFQHTDIDSWIQIFEHMFKGNQVVILFILLTVSLSKINSSSSIFSTHKKNTQIRFLTLFWQINSSGVGGFWVFFKILPDVLMILLHLIKNLSYILINPENKDFSNTAIKLVLWWLTEECCSVGYW